MSLEFQPLNWWAVLVAVVGNMVIGALWYSPVLFGNIWLKLIGKSSEDISKAEGNAAMAFSIIPAAGMAVAMALLVSLTGARTLVDALLLVLIAVVGLVGLTALNLQLFEDRPTGLTVVNVGYSVVSLGVAGVVLALWG